MIRAVIFDFGNVIALPVAPEKVARAAALCELSVEAFTQAFWAHRLEYDAGLLEPEAYWKTVLGKRYDPALLPALIRHEIDFWTDFDPRVLTWIDDLRASGILTGILSNLPRVLGEELRATPGFLDHFDHVTFSYELRMVKPAAAIYHHAFEGLKVSPSEALFIDDKQVNVDGAIAVGLHAELFTTWENFVRRKIQGLPDCYNPARPS